MPLAGVFFLIFVGVSGCSDNSTDAKNSAHSSKHTTPLAESTEALVKSEPAEKAATAEEVAAETTTKVTPAKTAPATATVADPITRGKQVYNSGCTACHTTGIAGAPKFGDKTLWANRIAKGKEVLVNNAINGFTGSTGVMPPKGGFVHLSDEDIAAAVDYMMQAAQ